MLSANLLFPKVNTAPDSDRKQQNKMISDQLIISGLFYSMCEVIMSNTLMIDAFRSVILM